MARFLFKPNVIYYKSRTQEGIKYQTKRQVLENGEVKVECQCKGFFYHKNCWHVNRVLTTV
jgi:hypothetical protein